MNDLLNRLHQSIVASCTCLCKTPEASFHDPMCRYRLTKEAIAEIERLTNGLKDILGDGHEDAMTWQDSNQDIIGQLKVASKFKANAVYNSEGAAAISELLIQMSVRLDSAIYKIRELLEDDDEDK